MAVAQFRKLPQKQRQERSKKAFVCSDPDLIKFGVTGKVTKVLDDAGLEYEIYSDIKANPTMKMLSMVLKSF